MEFSTLTPFEINLPFLRNFMLFLGVFLFNFLFFRHLFGFAMNFFKI
jgi:hypothetical protein